MSSSTKFEHYRNPLLQSKNKRRKENEAFAQFLMLVGEAAQDIRLPLIKNGLPAYLTYCEIRNGFKFGWGWAVCSMEDKDKFCRKTGREIAKQRATKRLQDIYDSRV